MKVKTALVAVIIVILPMSLKCQNYALFALVPEELNILIKNDQIESVSVYFTGPPREYYKTENKLIQIFRINRDDREIRELSMDYHSYYGSWTLYRFDEDWNIIEHRKYKEDTVVYASREYIYNENGEIIEERWVNTLNKEKVFSPYLHRKLIFQEDQVIQQTTFWQSKNPKTRNRVITDIFNSQGRLKKRYSIDDESKTITFYDRREREKKVRTYELETLTNKFSLKIKRRYKYEYVASENRLFEEMQIKKDSIIQIYRSEYFKDTLIHQETSENGETIFVQHRTYDGALLMERKIRGKGAENFSVYKYEYGEK